MKWVTRERVKVDRVACPWLIRRFIDPNAEFVFLPQDTDWAAVVDGTLFDVMGHGSAAELGSDQNAAIAGDVAMLENEVTPVLKALRHHGLDVVAIHQHMIGTQPAIIFLHYWGKGPADKLATGFKAALAELGTHSASRMAH